MNDTTSCEKTEAPVMPEEPEEYKVKPSDYNYKHKPSFMGYIIPESKEWIDAHMAELEKEEWKADWPKLCEYTVPPKKGLVDLSKGAGKYRLRQSFGDSPPFVCPEGTDTFRTESGFPMVWYSEHCRLRTMYKKRPLLVEVFVSQEKWDVKLLEELRKKDKDSIGADSRVYDYFRKKVREGYLESDWKVVRHSRRSFEEWVYTESLKWEDQHEYYTDIAYENSKD